MNLPFARWPNFQACVDEQKDIGHSEASAKKICGFIEARAEKGTLFKSYKPLEILEKSADGHIIIGGYASWELLDPQRDYVTTEAQVNFLKKFFDLPPEYHNISIDHTNFQMGVALLQYPEENPHFFSHVHEKGMYLIAKVRNDQFRRTQHYREQIVKGVYRMFSISGDPVENQTMLDAQNRLIRKVFDIDPFEVAIVKEGYNPKADFDILKQRVGEPKTDEERLISHFGAEKAQQLIALIGLDEAIKLLPPRGTQLKKQDSRPPKEWWDRCVAHVNESMPKYNQEQVAAVCGHIYWKVPGGKTASFKGIIEKGLKLLEKMTFDECVAQVSKNPDVRDPRAVCAAIGRKKHGQAEMTARSVAGRKGKVELETRQIFEKYFPTSK